MECDRRIVIYIVWMLVNGISASVSDSDNKNVSTASIKFPRFRNKIPAANNWQLRSSSSASQPQNQTSCSGLNILDAQYQPIFSSDTSFIRKCCPHGQSYQSTENGKKCMADTTGQFNVSVLNATFYDNCIEDNESPPNLEYRFVGACNSNAIDNNSMNQTLVFSIEYGDVLYVLQNGSLLTVQKDPDNADQNYDIFENYCLDMDRDGGFLYAIVCDLKVDANLHNRVLHAEAYLYSTCLLLSVPCLLLTAYLYVQIDELRDMHGKSLACHSVCLAVAYALLSVMQLQLNISLVITYFIQYFLLSCICWLNALCLDICINISYIYIKKTSCTINTEDKYFAAYAAVSFGLPFIPVLVASSRHISGIPLSYIKGQHNIDSVIENYFILPAAFLLFFCFCCLAITFYAFERRKPILPNENITPQLIGEYLEFFKLKQTAQSVAFLFAVMSICMLIEFAVSKINAATTPDDTTTMTLFAFFDFLIALQGVFIFIIFICSPKPLKIVKRWWVATGSLDVAAYAELEALKKTTLHA